MDDDEEVQSHPSPGSTSSDSPHRNHRIAVTVASAAPPPPPQNALALALPIQQPRTTGGGGGGGGGGGREDCWSERATAVLIDAWGERYLELSRGNLKQKHWKEVAEIVSSREDYVKAPKTDIQCKNRIDTVKKKYKLEKAKISSGGGPSNWLFFDRLDQLIGPTAATKSGSSSFTPSPLRAVPMGLPVAVRSSPVQSQRLKQQQERQQKLQQQQQKRIRPPPAYSDSSESEPEPPPEAPDSDSDDRKRPRVPFHSRLGRQQYQQTDQSGADKDWGDSMRELTRAIVKFGEAYEHVESSKLQQLVEMEKQRMKFAKELELQRMKFFMKTQMELSQIKHSRKGVMNNNRHHHNHNRSNHHHHSGNNNTVNNKNHSDDSNN